MKITDTSTVFETTDEVHARRMEQVADAVARAARTGKNATIHAVYRHTTGQTKVVDLFLLTQDRAYGTPCLLNLRGALAGVRYDERRSGWATRGGPAAMSLAIHLMRDLEDYLRRTGDWYVLDKVERWQDYVRVDVL